MGSSTIARPRLAWLALILALSDCSPKSGSSKGPPTPDLARPGPIHADAGAPSASAAPGQTAGPKEFAPKLFPTLQQAAADKVGYLSDGTDFLKENQPTLKADFDGDGTEDQYLIRS